MFAAHELSFYRLVPNRHLWQAVFNSMPQRRCVLCDSRGLPLLFGTPWDCVQAAYVVGFPRLAEEIEARVQAGYG